MSSSHSLALGDLPSMETEPTVCCFVSRKDLNASGASLLELNLPYKLVHECTQPLPKALSDASSLRIDQETVTKIPLYLDQLLNNHQADLVKAAGAICTVCKEPATYILYLLSNIDELIQVLGQPLCNGDPCIYRYMRMANHELSGASRGVPVRALYPYQAAQCLGCRGPSTMVEQCAFTLADPRPHTKMFSYTLCASAQCRFKIDDLKAKRIASYGTAQQSCAACGQQHVTAKCAKCRDTYYCGKECQKMHWTLHKAYCPKPFDGEHEARLAFKCTMLNEVNTIFHTGRLGPFRYNRDTSRFE